jgi:hypothetical protein
MFPKEHYKKSAIDHLGMGIALYFKLLKFIGFLMLLFCLFSIPALAISSTYFAQALTNTGSFLTNFFLATSIGAIGVNANSCYMGQLYSSSSNTVPFSLSCANGLMAFND